MAKILVVDDEEPVRILLSAAFSLAGHEVKTAASPTDALKACSEQECFDVVVCDIVLPEMDGHQLTRRIAALSPRSRVIHISGFDPGCDECPYVQRCPVVKKPFIVSEVVAIATDALGKPPVDLR